MWNDVETTQDFLNFSVIAKTVAELISESGDKPISIGVSGSWGAGKSSMVKMIGESLKFKDKDKGAKEKNIFSWNSMHGYTKAMMTLGQLCYNQYQISSLRKVKNVAMKQRSLRVKLKVLLAESIGFKLQS